MSTRDVGGSDPSQMGPLESGPPPKSEPSPATSAFQKAVPHQGPQESTDFVIRASTQQIAASAFSSTSERVSLLGDKKVAQPEGKGEPHPRQSWSLPMQNRILKAEEALESSVIHPSVERRIADTPEVPGAKGAGGSYFVSGRTLLIKPASQEPGIDDITSYGNDHAMFPGQGAIRERMAYALQEIAGLPAAIPETVVHTFKHEVFGFESTSSKSLEELQRHTRISRQEAARLMLDSPDGTFVSAWKKHLLAKLEQLFPDQELRNRFLVMVEDPDPDNCNFIPFYRRMDDEGLSDLPIKPIAKLLCGLWEAMHEPQSIETAGKSIYESIAKPQMAVSATFCSAQTVVQDAVSFSKIVLANDNKEALLIPQSEFEKFTIDFLLNNMDRHLGNVLAKKVSVTELQQQLALATPKEQARIHKLLEHANNVQSDAVYELHLIDHGYTFPDPDLASSEFENIKGRFEFRHLAQAKQPLSADMSTLILSLDPANIVATLRQDLQQNQAHYGASCAVSDATYQFLHFSCLALQEAVRQGKTIEQLADIFEWAGNGKLLELYRQEVHKKPSCDWTSIQEKLPEVLLTTMEGIKDEM